MQYIGLGTGLGQNPVQWTGRVWYVRADGGAAGSVTGLTPEQAYNFPQDAITAATSGDMIKFLNTGGTRYWSGTWTLATTGSTGTGVGSTYFLTNSGASTDILTLQGKSLLFRAATVGDPVTSTHAGPVRIFASAAYLAVNAGWTPVSGNLYRRTAGASPLALYLVDFAACFNTANLSRMPVKLPKRGVSPADATGGWFYDSLNTLGNGSTQLYVQLPSTIGAITGYDINNRDIARVTNNNNVMTLDCGDGWHSSSGIMFGCATQPLVQTSNTTLTTTAGMGGGGDYYFNDCTFVGGYDETTAANGNGLTVNDGRSLTLVGCEFSQCSNDGLNTKNTHSVVAERCYSDNMGDDCFATHYAQSVRFTSCIANRPAQITGGNGSGFSITGCNAFLDSCSASNAGNDGYGLWVTGVGWGGSTFPSKVTATNFSALDNATYQVAVQDASQLWMKGAHLSWTAATATPKGILSTGAGSYVNMAGGTINALTTGASGTGITVASTGVVDVSDIAGNNLTTFTTGGTRYPAAATTAFRVA